jgi:ketosteroid isomerase-like protein
VKKEEHDALVSILLRPERERTTLEERVQLVEDKEAIRDVIMQYGFLCDAGRWDDLLELYTDDIERVLAGSLDEHVKGKDALLRLYVNPVLPVRDDGKETKTRLQSPTSGVRAARHLISTHAIRVSDDNREAWASAQYSLVLTSIDGDHFERGEHEGAYTFSFRKENGRWKCCKLVVIANSLFNPMNRRVAAS